MDALCRELGSCARAGAVIVPAEPLESALHTELRALKVTQLKKRARACATADPDKIDATDDAADAKMALIALIVELEAT